MSSNYRLIVDMPPPSEFIPFEPYSVKGSGKNSFALYSLAHTSETQLSDLKRNVTSLNTQGRLTGLCSADFRPEILVFSSKNDYNLKENQPAEFAKLIALCMNVKTHLFVVSGNQKPFVAKLGPKDAMFHASKEQISPGSLFGGTNDLLKHSLNRYEWTKTLALKYTTPLQNIAFISEQEEQDSLSKEVGFYISTKSQPKIGTYLQSLNATFLSLLLFGRDISSIRGEIW